MLRHLLAALMILLFASSFSFATTTTGKVNPACPDAKVFSNKLITAIDWDTLYPIRIAGAKLGGGRVPDGAADPRMFCICPDNNDVPRFGTQIGMYRPSRLFEIVRAATCSPTLGGTMLQKNTRLIGGPKAMEFDTTDTTFYSVNIWAFPLTSMLNLFSSVRCGTDYYVDIDLINTSAVDPTWNDDELSILFTPESFIFATPAGIAMDLIDATSSTAGRPINKFIGSAGAWGHLYPLTGTAMTVGSPIQDSSLIMAKSLAKLHRIGFARRTMGKDVMCKAKISPTITKTQYKFSMFFPVPEISGRLSDMFQKWTGGTPGSTTTGTYEDGTPQTDDDASLDTSNLTTFGDRKIPGSHVFGASTYLWGEWRNRPGTGEDFLYIMWSWIDCCASKEGVE